MCEDSVEKLSTDTARKPLDILIPKLIALFSCADEMVRNEQYLHYQNSSRNDIMTHSISNKITYNRCTIGKLYYHTNEQRNKLDEY